MDIHNTTSTIHSLFFQHTAATQASDKKNSPVEKNTDTNNQSSYSEKTKNESGSSEKHRCV